MAKKITNFPIEVMRFKNYIEMIRNSAITPTITFRNAYVINQKNKVIDATENGNISCAYFMSAMLYLQKFIQDMHLGVNGLIRDMEACGFYEINRPRVGAVILWGPEGPRSTRHVGMYNGQQKIQYNVIKDKYFNTHRYEVLLSGSATNYKKELTIPTAICNIDFLGRPGIIRHDFYGLNGRTTTREIQGIYWHPLWDMLLGKK